MWYEDLNTLVISMYPSTHSPIFPSTNQHPSIHPFINWILRDLNVNSDSDWFIFVHLWFIVKWHHPKNQLRSETHTHLFSLCHINVFQWERPGIWFPWIQTVYQIHMSNSNSSQIQRMKPNRRPEPSVRLSTPAGTSPSPCESWFVCVCVNDVNKKEVKKKKTCQNEIQMNSIVFLWQFTISHDPEKVFSCCRQIFLPFSVCAAETVWWRRAYAASTGSHYWKVYIRITLQKKWLLFSKHRGTQNSTVIVKNRGHRTLLTSHRTGRPFRIFERWVNVSGTYSSTTLKGRQDFLLTASDDTVLLTSTSWCPRLRD